MRGRLGLLIIAGALIALWPSAARAQSAIAGVVRDTSGAVLPGVTVEAASPALIEKTRAVTTDSEGRYNIVDLRPGRVLRHLLAGGVQHRQARWGRTSQQLHRNHQRRPEGRVARGNHHGFGAVAGRRHLDGRAAAGAQPGRARLGADRPIVPASARCCRAHAWRSRTSAGRRACRTAT